ncbi:MAG: nickel pincer cofactor biosynthesis protein LarC, partial [Deltaproteobacteria bacterium]|nr:nickel pincer cofactor biosynthesis protein LarC [Deltaproteobacteria bacterium]
RFRFSRKQEWIFMKILYFDCFSGVSGDMTLSALVHLGLPEDRLRQELQKLGWQNYSLEFSRGSRSGISALAMQVIPGQKPEDPRHFSSIRQRIAESPLSEKVKEISIAIFQRLAEGEARVHNQPIAEVHFHEVGAIDSIVDIVGTAIGIDYFKPDRILTSFLPMGRGFVDCRHGRLPLPAPATLEILKGYPTQNADVEGELVTPTGAAIVASLSQGAETFPAMKIEKIGYGMGKREFPDRPNLLRLVMGEANDTYEADRVVVLEANIDDMNPEFYDYLMEGLFRRGALDVSLSPLMMKKNRPGTLLRVIAEEREAERLGEFVLDESTTLGVRSYSVKRKKIASGSPRSRDAVWPDPGKSVG